MANNRPRIKVKTSWLECEDNPLGKWASDYARDRVVTAMPNHGLVNGIRAIKVNDKKGHDSVHELEFKLDYKSAFYRVQPFRWSSAFRAIVALKDLEAKAPSAVQFKLEYDLQPHRLPWVFVDQQKDGIVNNIAFRPDSVSHNIILDEVTTLPKGPGRYFRIFDDTEKYLPTVANEIMIVGERRAAYKAYRYLNQLNRGATLHADDKHDSRNRSAVKDLVVILTRNTEVSQAWHIYSEDNPNCTATWMKYALSCTEEQSPATYMGLNYTVVKLEEPIYQSGDLAI